MLVPDEIRKCAVFVGCRTCNGEMKLGGTAFFVGSPVEGTNRAFCYLVTAKHVLEEVKKRGVDEITYLRTNLHLGETEWIQIPIGRWRLHPEDKVDVAVLPLAPPYELIDYRWVPVSTFVTRSLLDQRNIGVGDEVFLTGLFVNHYGLRKNIPIVRTGSIAAMPEEPVQTKKGPMDAFLIEARSIGGLSGSPVFARFKEYKPGKLTEFYYLLGLVHGHWDLVSTDIDLIGEDAMSDERINMGIAIVVPASKILEILDQPELVQVRLKEEARLRTETKPSA